MAVAVVLDFPGASLDGYDRVREGLGFGCDGHGPEGVLFHWVAPTATGIRIVDVWRDRDLAEDFVRDHLAPASRRMGLSEPPDVEVLEVHCLLRERAESPTPGGGRPGG